MNLESHVALIVLHDDKSQSCLYLMCLLSPCIVSQGGELFLGAKVVIPEGTKEECMRERLGIDFNIRVSGWRHSLGYFLYERDIYSLASLVFLKQSRLLAGLKTIIIER